MTGAPGSQRENTTPESGEPVDMGYLGLPGELQEALERGLRGTPTAAELTAIRPGSDPLWITSACCHRPHHADTRCPRCGGTPDLKAELARRHEMLVKANALIERLRAEPASSAGPAVTEDRSDEKAPRYDGESVPVLRQALWDCYAAAGADTDGELACPPPGAMTPDVHVLALEAVRELRADYSEALAEIPSGGTVTVSREDLRAVLSLIRATANTGYLAGPVFGRLSAAAGLGE